MVSSIPIQYKQFAQLHGFKYSYPILIIFKQIYLTLSSLTVTKILHPIEYGINGNEEVLNTYQNPEL